MIRKEIDYFLVSYEIYSMADDRSLDKFLRRETDIIQVGGNYEINDSRDMMIYLNRHAKNLTGDEHAYAFIISCTKMPYYP